MKNLIKQNILSYYWMGFLMADGYFDHVRKRISVVCSLKDKEHIKKFSQFINSKIVYRKNDTTYKKGTEYYICTSSANPHIFASRQLPPEVLTDPLLQQTDLARLILDQSDW